MNFIHGINYKYEGMPVHSFNRFYVVTKFILPSIGDLKFSKLYYDNTCIYIRQQELSDHWNKETYVRSNDFLQKDRTICNVLQKIDKII